MKILPEIYWLFNNGGSVSDEPHLIPRVLNAAFTCAFQLDMHACEMTVFEGLASALVDSDNDTSGKRVAAFEAYEENSRISLEVSNSCLPAAVCWLYRSNLT